MYMDNIKNYQEALNPKRKDLYKNIFATYQKMIDHWVICFWKGTIKILLEMHILCNSFEPWEVGLIMYNLGLLDLALFN